MIVKYITFCHNLLHNLLQSLIFASNYNELHCKYNEKARKNKRTVIANEAITHAGVYVIAGISQGPRSA